MIKKILFVIISLIFFSATFKAQSNEEIIKVETSLVNIPVIVSDRDGRYISGLTTQNFTVLEDGKPQKIEYFASEESPINVAILMDTSRSTQEVLEEIKDAAKGFIKQLKPTDRALIASFDNNVEFLSGFTSNRKELNSAIENAEIGERAGTVLNDALFEVVDKKFSKVTGRKAIILLTDGKDIGSYVTKNELLYRLEESDTLVYSIFYKTENFRRMSRNRPDIFFPNRRNQRRNRFPNRDDFPRQNRVPNNPRRILQEEKNEEAATFLQNISVSTAGRLFENEIGDLDATFKTIADELRKQYLIGYYPENSEKSNTIHQIKVRVNKKDAVVRAKNSYRSQ